MDESETKQTFRIYSKLCIFHTLMQHLFYEARANFVYKDREEKLAEMSKKSVQ